MSSDTFVYDGTEKKPSVIVKDGGTVIPDSEYTVEYSNNINVGTTATVTVTDNENGNYTVNGTNTFAITAKPLTGAKVGVSGSFTYTGSALTPDPVVTLGEKTLVKDTDYTVAYDKNTNAGTATVTVTGKGNYTGTVSGQFTIGRANLTADGTGTASGTYGAKLSDLTVSGLTAKLGEGTATAKFTINPVETVDLPESDGKKLKLELETGLSTIPDTLKAEYESPAKIEDKLKTVVTAADTSIPKENTAVYDAELLVSTDDGKTWEPATEGNFPSAGLTITLPYPKNTDSSYTFTVVHMFTRGEKAGKTETLKGKTTADGVQCTVTGLSPISLGWVKKTSQGGSSGGGWYPSVSYYNVKVDKTEHGTVTASPTSASSGSTVTLTVKPDEGYKLDKITVTDSQNKALELTEKDGRYTFKMPGREVTVKAEFVPVQTVEPSPEPWKNPFPDVKDTEWYIEAIEYVSTEGLMAGYPNGKAASRFFSVCVPE